MSDEKKLETPFYEFYGYTAEEWRLRNYQERHGNADWENAAFEYDWNEIEDYAKKD